MSRGWKTGGHTDFRSCCFCPTPGPRAATRQAEVTARHRLVVKLRAIGKSRQEISRVTGYSCSHISRITAMRQAIQEEAVDRQLPIGCFPQW
jgi:hypothetical protein